jgi:hypothetical protein
MLAFSCLYSFYRIAFLHEFLRIEEMLQSLWSVCGLLLVRLSCSEATRRAMSAIVECEDVRAVGALVEALEVREARPLAALMLTHLLPQLKAGNTTLLSDVQWERLYSLLLGKQAWLGRVETDFTLAILQALQQAGPMTALPVVQKLAAREGRSGRDARLVQAAQECLLCLRQEAQHRSHRDTLLRANKRQDTPDLLLRPVGTTVSEQATHLLRAAGTEQ